MRTLGLTAALVACQSRSDTATEKKLEELKLTPSEAKRILAELSTKRAEHEAHPAAPAVAPSPEAPSPTGTVEREGPASAAGWIIDELQDIGPAAPSTATHQGVFLVNGANELFLAKLGRLSTAPSSASSPIGVVPEAKGPFALGRGPVFTPSHAYWVTSHYLLRRPSRPPYGPLEIVAKDARVGTRAAAWTSPSGNSVVAYVALPVVKNGPLRAKLWLEGSELEASRDLTETGNSALSVALVGRGTSALALSLEARMGVTALHARPLDPATGKLGADDVLWIGGTAQPFTEVRAHESLEGWTTLLAMEQDSSHFGLAFLSQSEGGKELRERWLTFPNGLDPSPLATARACGRDWVLFARPSDPTPKAPQELALARIEQGTGDMPTVLSHAKAFYDVSLAGIDGGLLVSFVADQRTWARTLRCGARAPAR